MSDLAQHLTAWAAQADSEDTVVLLTLIPDLVKVSRGVYPPADSALKQAYANVLNSFLGLTQHMLDRQRKGQPNTDLNRQTLTKLAMAAHCLKNQLEAIAT
jgi:hypothetical protein